MKIQNFSERVRKEADKICGNPKDLSGQYPFLTGRCPTSSIGRFSLALVCVANKQIK